MRNACLGQLPRGQPGALQQRPGLVDEYFGDPAAGVQLRTAPSAVPNAVVASRPVLQCVSTRNGRRDTAMTPGRPRGRGSPVDSASSVIIC